MSQQPAPKPPLLLDRVKALEELTNGMAAYVQNEIPGLKSALANIVEVLNGIIRASGEDFPTKLQAAVKADRDARTAEQVAREKAQLDSMVESGALQPADVVSETSVVVGREFNLEGELLGSGRTQVMFNQFTPESQEKVKGQGIGFVIEVATGKFEVTEIYNIVPPKAPVVTDAPAEDTSHSSSANPEGN